MVVAHPDDETIFFGGILQVFRRYPWHVICVTDGNADGEGMIRRADFMKACKQLRVANAEMWDFPDIYEKRLDVVRLQERLAQLPKPAAVFSHGILGEYGHPHHQDVSIAVHRHFCHPIPVWSAAYNSFPQKIFRLSKKTFAVKQKVLSETYFSQTKNFARWLPCTHSEGIHQLDLKEVEALYAFFQGQELRLQHLKIYKDFAPYLENLRKALEDRAF